MLPLKGLGSVGLVSLNQLVVWRHDVLRPGRVRLVNTITIMYVLVVTRRLKVGSPFLIISESVHSREGHMMREVVVGRPIGLDQLQVLPLDGVVMLPGHVIVDLVGVLRDVPDCLNLHGDSSIEPSLMEGLDKDMLLIVNQLKASFLPSFLVSSSSRPDPLTPVKPLEPGHQCRQILPFTILEHLLTIFKWILHINVLRIPILPKEVPPTGGIWVSEPGVFPDLGDQGGEELKEGGHGVQGGG